jgi:hypothetical protein
MGILDEAIKEHLELKRQHGAAEPELQQLEDEAFGAAERPGTEPSPDPLAEAPTEFMEQSDLVAAPEGGAEEGSARRRPAPQIADLQEAPQAEPEAPAEEEAPAMEHEAVSAPEVALELEPEAEAEPEPSVGPSTEERHAIAEQPTEMFDVEEELAASETRAPSEEELVEEATAEPRLAPVDPLADIEAVDDLAEIQVEEVNDSDVDDEFWDEKRLSDELDQALEAPRESEPASEEEPRAEEDERPSGGAETELQAPEDEAASEEPSRARDEDVLEETPDFLEEAPEDDKLWFEQKPPKDFDFDD